LFAAPRHPYTQALLAAVPVSKKTAQNGDGLIVRVLPPEVPGELADCPVRIRRHLGHYGDRVSVPMVGGLQQLVAGGDLGQQLADAKSHRVRISFDLPVNLDHELIDVAGYVCDGRFHRSKCSTA
jgi:hypothetical protein